MSYDPYKIIPAVLVAVTSGQKILLTRRKNTSYMDGWYSLPGGHMEENETLQECGAREIEEETGLSVSPNDLALYMVYQNQNTPDKNTLDSYLELIDTLADMVCRKINQMMLIFSI